MLPGNKETSMSHSLTVPPESQHPASLASLAKKANRAHAACEKAVRSALEHAKLCGETLIEAKSLVGHGEFEKWLAKNCKFSPQMARRYMTLARGWEQLVELSKGNRGFVFDCLSAREALRLLSAGGYDDLPVEYTSQLCPSCHSPLVVSSKLYATCAHCWECRLYPIQRIGKPRPELKLMAAQAAAPTTRQQPEPIDAHTPAADDRCHRDHVGGCLLAIEQIAGRAVGHGADDEVAASLMHLAEQIGRRHSRASTSPSHRQLVG